MKFVNLTAHAVLIAARLGGATSIPPSGQVARCTMNQTLAYWAEGVPVYSTEYGAIENLPEPEVGTVYIVSTLVAQAAARKDVVSPDRNAPLRRKDGKAVGVKALQTFFTGGTK